MVRETWYDITCEVCGKEFKSRMPITKRCEDCRKALKRARFKTHLDKPRVQKPKECERCHNIFTPRASNVKLCDDCKAEMKYLHSIRQPILKCPLCGRLFIRTGNNQKRCKLCQFKQLYKNNYRTIAFENLPHVCNRCGKEVDILTANVHHKDRNRKNNDLSNLEILCTHCHHMEHIVRDPATGKIITNK